MLKKPVFVWLILIAILGVSSCSNYQKLYKSDDVDAKYEMALKYYSQENYYRALELLEAVIPFYRAGTSFCNYSTPARSFFVKPKLASILLP